AAMEVCRAQRRDGVANTNGSYSDSDWTFELANTWGACLQWREVRIRIAGQAVAGEGDRREAAFDFRDGTVGWELVKALDLAEFGRGVANEAVEMLSAAKPPAGLMTVVTDPGVSGLLAHEVMGHASEGDEIVKKRSFLTGKWISGMEDPVGGSFQAVTLSGFRIQKGEVRERVRGMTLTGDALSILKSVDRVSKEIALDGGSCGKGEEDYVPVAAGGPY